MEKIDLGFANLVIEIEKSKETGIPVDQACIYLEAYDGHVIQDICLVHKAISPINDSPVGTGVQCYIWGDSSDDNYTHCFNIPMYTDDKMNV